MWSKINRTFFILIMKAHNFKKETITYYHFPIWNTFILLTTMASKTQLSVEWTSQKSKSRYIQIFHRQFYGDRPHTTQMPKIRRIHTCSSTANTAMKWSECWLNGADDWYGTGTEHKWQIKISISHQVRITQSWISKTPPLPPHPPPTLLGLNSQ